MLLSGFFEVVQSTGSGTAGLTLAQAINRIDGNPDTTSLNTVVFHIPTTDPGYDPAKGTFTTTLPNALPDIMRPVFIDGTSESKFLGQFALIVVSGSKLNAPADGLTLDPSAPGSTILDLEIFGFNGSGIVINSPGNTIGGAAAGEGNILASNAAAGISIPAGAVAPSQNVNNLLIGNFIGTDSLGANLGNRTGIIIGSTGNTIGGITPGAANVIGLNKSAGIAMSAGTNLVLGDFIGTDSAGRNLANPIGIAVNSQNNTIGGATSGAANVIGNNTSEGILISGDRSISNVVLGNFIGTSATGANLGNNIGVLLQAANNTIGGTSAGAANVFGFNTQAGLQITGAGATNEVVTGNFFGTNASGDNLGNVVGALVQTPNNTIGGSSVTSANVFGNNIQFGLVINGTSATDNLVLGNFFGTNTGEKTLTNLVGLIVESASNTIGGAAAQSANVFGANDVAGLQITGPNGTNNLVIGNYFGTNASGARFPNQTGLLLDSRSNTIGGTATGSGNVFALSANAGLEIRDPSATNNLVLGNLFGTNASGDNLGNAVGLKVDSASNTIGGTSPGAGNVFAFNSSAGAKIAGDFATGNILIGNLIGSNAPSANPSNSIGIDIESGRNTIGGTTPGSANLISLNDTAGVQITGAKASGNVLVGNLIGTNSTGEGPLANGIGVLISGGTGNVIGGTTPGAANVISGNTTAGIFITGNSVTGTQIIGNKIGTDPSGMNAVTRANLRDKLSALQNAGIAIIGSVGNTVGGTGQAANVISGNYVGVNLASIPAGAGQNLVIGNLIGTNISGNAPVENIVGIYINSAAGSQIGAPGAPNTISGNNSVGVEIYGAGSMANLVEANMIGPASNGKTALMTNGRFVQPTGVFIMNASRNSIGGTTSATGNVISGNQNAGVYIFSQAVVSSKNVVQRNLVGLSSGGGQGPGNNGYGVLLLSSPNNLVRLTGAAANRFGRNLIANFRKLTQPTAATRVKAAKSRAQIASPGSSAHQRLAHPPGPMRHRMRKISR
jgi:hypothetical protein